MKFALVLLAALAVIAIVEVKQITFLKILNPKILNKI